MKKINVISLGLLAFFFISGCASEGEGYGKFKNMSAKQILADGEKELSKHNYNSASKRFEAIDALYPFSKEAEQGELDSIYAYYKADDIPAALAAADKYIHLYPRNPHTDYAYYMKGLANFDRGKTWTQKFKTDDEDQRDIAYAQQAFVDFSDLIKMFPDSIYVKDAYERMHHIRNLLAQRELDGANFYMDRKAYVAAANRASYVVKHFEGAPQVPEALKVMIKAYDALGAKKLENDTRRIFQLNFPQEKA
jgi:outer membrane protein assembly factor BamD